MSVEPKLGLRFPQILAGALAAASAAVASSWLGVAGTVIGAAVMSVVASVASVLYARPLERSHERLRAAMPTIVPLRTGVAPAGGQDTAVLTMATDGPEQVADGSSSGDSHPDRSPRARLRRRWRAVAVGSAAMLVGGMALLTGFELVAGDATSLTGGRDKGLTIVRAFQGGGSDGSTTDPTTGTGGDSGRDGSAESDGTTGSQPGGHPSGSDQADPVDGSTGSGLSDSEPTRPTQTEPTQTEPSPTTPTETEPTPTAPTTPTTPSGTATESGSSATGGAEVAP